MTAVWETQSSLQLQNKVEELTESYLGDGPLGVLRASYQQEFPSELALVSSFGTESALLLAFAAEIDPDFPVIFVDSGKLFPDTLRYREMLIEQLGLTNVTSAGPDQAHLRADDPDGTLHEQQPDYCCHIRKTLPLLRALRPYRAWVSGRKRFHGGQRSNLPVFEHQDGRIKLNPLALISQSELRREMRQRGLPDHPLREAGYLSVGCIPCTAPTDDQADVRSGRWHGTGKTECGIHFTADGQIVRPSQAES